MTSSKYFRDAARVARQQANEAKIKHDYDREVFWRKQAGTFHTEADKWEAIEVYRSQRDDMVLMLCREALFNDWQTGYSDTLDNPYTCEILIGHPYAGFLSFKILKKNLPPWVPVYTGAPFMMVEDTWDLISEYLRSEK